MHYIFIHKHAIVHTPILKDQVLSGDPLIASLSIIVWQQPTAIITVKIDALYALLPHKCFSMCKQCSPQALACASPLLRQRR
jgi:hypothetical protein